MKLIGPYFTKLTNSITSATKGILSGYAAVEGAICAVTTFVGETLTLNDREGGLIGVMYDTVTSFIPNNMFTNTFIEFPYLVGKGIKSIANEQVKYSQKVFKALHDYDTAELIFKDLLPKSTIKLDFMTFNTFDIIINQLVKYFFDSIFKQNLMVYEVTLVTEKRDNTNITLSWDMAFEYLATNRNMTCNESYVHI
ncbi:hypothetical protein [Methanosphaera sp. WGK6]|uniref:hypothetical protein n=1 Tax=Methanosphaera sp. WGK6 TaxID=1561964 RepID=UPI00084CDD37|nr:hypothetical protein [Methanosphaera sp. WGK6]OED30788.1 hypothetical protein NL43_00245 [Methanosphaera sp. WGK6]